MHTALKKVLVVDDSPFIRWGMTEDLRRLGYLPFEAESGTDALAVLQQERDISLVLLDVQMKGLSGFETLRRIRASDMQLKLREVNNLWVPVVFVTSQDTQEDRRRGFDLGALDFITKHEVRSSLKELTDKYLTTSKELASMGVLIVDDSGIVRHVVRTCLKSLGVHLFEAVNGREGLELLRANPDKIDLVVTDLVMPVMNGDELCMTIHNEEGLADLPVIFISSSESELCVLKMFQAGAADYVHKPFVRQELTARLESHLKRRLLTKQLKDSVEDQKHLNEVKDQFLAVCSHDLRSPLSGMLGLIQLVAEDPTCSEEHRGMLRFAEQSGEYLLSLVTDILDLGRAEAERSKLELMPVDLRELIDSCMKTLRHTAEPKNVRLDLLCPEPVTVHGNGNALRRIFNNLISNAIKFTHAGEGVAVVIVREGTNAVTRVMDNGIGIPQDMISELFDQYSKVSRKGTGGEVGTGLGLAITKKLTEAQHGRISVESQDGEGAVFTVVLPLERERPVVSVDPANLPGSLPGLRVLVAEDNRVNQETIRRRLVALACEYTLVSDGKEAVAAFRNALTKEPFDVVLMDIEMPIMNGMEAVREVRRLEHEHTAATGMALHTPVYALTAYNDANSSKRFMNSGMDGILTKPFKAEQLFQCLDEVACAKSDG